MPLTSSSSMDGGSGSGGGSMSTVVTDTATGWHVLRISCYSATKASGNKCIKSGKFNVGGHTWYIAYYPVGYNDESVGFISVFLFLDEAASDDDDAVVNARCKFSLLDHEGKPDPAYSRCYGKVKSFKPASSSGWGHKHFIKTDALWEGSKHFKHDCFSIRCDVTVILGIRTEATAMQVVPPSDMHKHLGELLSKGEGADVTFDVGGELFAAHKNVLAARSSVFKAELFGAMKENTAAAPVVIGDTEASVFKALLHFIYTDSPPDIEVVGEEIVMAQHLLVAADRYDLKRLKLICENKLICSGVTKRTAMTTLVLAEQHGCRELKEACFAYLSSLGSVKAVMDTDGYDHLRSSCPSLHDELIAKLDVSKIKKIRRSLWCLSVS